MADQRNVTAVVDASPELLAVAILARAARHAMDATIADHDDPMVVAYRGLELALDDVEARDTEAERVARDTMLLIALQWDLTGAGLVRDLIRWSVRYGARRPS